MRYVIAVLVSGTIGAAIGAAVTTFLLLRVWIRQDTIRLKTEIEKLQIDLAVRRQYLAAANAQLGQPFDLDKPADEPKVH